MPRIAIAMFAHEGNSFCPVATDLAAFHAKVWLEGDAVGEAFRGTASEMGAALDFLDRHPGWQGSFLRCAATTPAGPLTRTCFETVVAEIVAGLAGGSPWDAVYLALHGAMVAEHMPSADLEVMRRVRAAIGPQVPLGASFDFHANLDPGTVALLDMAAGYKTYPHVDQHETACRVLEGLAGIVAGTIRPVGALAKLDAILPSIAMRTAQGPMAELEAMAAAMEGEGLLDATVFGGFSYGDTPSAGACAMVHADGDRERAQACADALRDAMAARRDRFFVTLPGPAQAVSQVLSRGRLPVAITDPGDNPLSGGTADTPGLLAAVLAARPEVPVVFAYFWDRDLVVRAAAAGIGARLETTLGAVRSDGFGAPVSCHATVEAVLEARYRGNGPMGTGVTVDFGTSVLLALAGTSGRVIVTSSCANLIDTGLFDLFGIDVRAPMLLCVKAKNHFRAAFAPLMAEIVDCDAPGPAALRIEGFAFRHAPAHLYPLQGAAR